MADDIRPEVVRRYRATDNPHRVDIQAPVDESLPDWFYARSPLSMDARRGPDEQYKAGALDMLAVLRARPGLLTINDEDRIVVLVVRQYRGRQLRGVIYKYDRPLIRSFGWRRGQ